MPPIIRFSSTYMSQIAAAMQQVASIAKSAEEISQHAYNIQNTWKQADVTVFSQSNVSSQPPQPTQPTYIWLTWLWDPYSQVWRVARWGWNGQQWTWVWA